MEFRLEGGVRWKIETSRSWERAPAFWSALARYVISAGLKRDLCNRQHRGFSGTHVPDKNLSSTMIPRDIGVGVVVNAARCAIDSCALFRTTRGLGKW